MNEVQIFDNLKVKEVNGQVMFDAESTAIGLGLTQTKNGKIYVQWKRVNNYLNNFSAHVRKELGVPTSGDGINSPQVEKGDFITEPQFYKLAIKANNETAEKFQDWVTSEVLPSIRKHGAYMTNQTIEQVLSDPDTIIKIATDLKKERQQNAVLVQRVNELEPKASYYDKILQNNALVNISVIAKDYGMSAVKMNKLLHELGVQFKQGGMWLLYAKHQKKGWTKSNTTVVTKSDGTEKLVMNTKWTQKGCLGLYELLKANGYLPLIEQDSVA